MNFTLAAMLGLTTLAQPPAVDYYPLNSANIKLPIDYKKDKRTIAQVQLFVCENGDQVWKQVGAAPPTQEAFVYNAPADGLYWFHIVIVDMQGHKDPANLTAEPPAMKVLVDTSRPYVTLANAKRTGDETTIEWKVEDKYPDEMATKVYFRDSAAPVESWKEVSLHPSSRNGVRFKTGASGAIVVRVAVRDLAGNTGELLREFPAPGANSQTMSLSPGTPAVSGTAATQPWPPVSGDGATSPSLPRPIAPAAPSSGAIPPPPSLAPQDLGSSSGPVAPAVGGGSVAPATPAASVSPLLTGALGGNTPPVGLPAAPPGMGNPLAVGQGRVTPAEPQPRVTQPLAQSDSLNPAVPGGSNNGFGGNVPVGYGVPPVSPTVEVSRAQVISTPQFDLNYEVEQGLSGISRVLLYMTRDDGQTWVKWSEHEGRGGQVPVRVVLNRSDNRQIEGSYGFRLVPVSGAGLSDRPPVAGDTPDLKVVLDLTPPRVAIYPPTSDPAGRDTLLLNWQAADANFGESPISLEWSEQPSGPWRPVVAAEGVVPAAAGSAPRVANSGQHAWRVPPGLPPRVYLKVTARDAAGNATEVVTPSPILVDLTKPRAKITGIGAPTPVLHRQ